MNKQIISRIYIPIICLCLWATPLLGANAPITVEADRMSSLENENSVLFSGNVDATQDDIRIRADEMTVYYTKKSKEQKQEVKRLKCTGDVEITRGKWLGTGKTMNYMAKDRTVILSGDAKAWQDKNLITGETIVYYLDEKRSEVIAGKKAGTGGKPGRVKATLTPQ